MNGTVFEDFIEKFGDMLDRTQDESEILGEGARLLEMLVARDGWLAPEFAEPARIDTPNISSISIRQRGFRLSASCGVRTGNAGP